MVRLGGVGFFVFLGVFWFVFVWVWVWFCFGAQRVGIKRGKRKPQGRKEATSVEDRLE